ncbi:1-aminocyclopropane-1-carboxylate synthase 2 [Penicillium rolfsii]|nr:1-aminocyclopropane-1-carboxylate synthase 2 [Penicillium rolfsii]
MLSSRCQHRNEAIIPSLLSQHDAVLVGGQETIDLSTAENWPVKQKVLEELRGVSDRLVESDLAYSSGIGGCSKTRGFLAELFNTHFRPAENIESSHIVLAAGGSFALTALIEQICDPGDGVLIASPYWAGLDISISIHSHASIVPVHVPLNEFFGLESVQYYESAIKASSIPIKAVLVCNPHNPLGQCYQAGTIRAMQEFCQKHDLHYISDEVYALSVHRPYPAGFTSFASVLEVRESHMSDRTHVLYSLSKDFGCNGMRLGALISQSNEAVRLSAALSLHSQVSSLSTALSSQLISSDATVRKITEYGGEQLNLTYMIIRSFLETQGTEFVPVASGMFVFARLLNVATVKEEQELLKHIKAAGVAISSGTSYHFQQPGWFRICYGVPREQLQEGLRRLDVGIQNYLRLVTQ